MLELLEPLELIVPLAGLLVGLVLVALALVHFLLATFRENTLWGLACLVVPFVGAVFLVAHWPTTRRPFFLQVAGTALALIGAALMPDLGSPSG